MWLKQAEKLDLYQPVKRLVETMRGKEDGALIDTPLKSFQRIRDEISQTDSHKTDSTSLERLIADTTVYISVWNCITKNISFGTGQVYIKFSVECY